MQNPHACVVNEPCECLKTMYSSRNRGRAVKATHSFANYNVFLSIVVIMTSLAYPSITVAISCEFTPLQGTITWCFSAVCTTAYFVQKEARSDVF